MKQTLAGSGLLQLRMTMLCGSLGRKEAARFAVYTFLDDFFTAKRAASFLLVTLIKPVILNELVRSERSTSEMKDLLGYTGILRRVNQ